MKEFGRTFLPDLVVTLFGIRDIILWGFDGLMNVEINKCLSFWICFVRLYYEIIVDVLINSESKMLWTGMV